MTAHLALNLLWLALFLRDDARGHVGALLVGWAATGLHQTIFHPLFAAPFILGLWLRRRRALAVSYLAAYAVIFGFWTLYWRLLLAAEGLNSPGSVDLGFTFFLVRVWWMLRDFSVSGFGLMLDNLLRAASWQNLAILVLLPLSWPAIRRGDGIARELAAGLALTVAAMLVLLAYQGHGWGYRYIHGLLGSMTLLAGYGWIAATSGAQGITRRAWTSFAAATLATLLVLLPWRLDQAVSFMAPYRTAVDAIRSKPADLVLVDWRGLQFGGDLVRNDPFLRNAPKILDYTHLTGEQVRELCARYRVDAFDAADGARLGIARQTMPQLGAADPLPPVRDMLANAGCGPAAKPSG